MVRTFILDCLPNFFVRSAISPGSWHVPALPGNYGTEEWQTIASLLGIQTGAVGGFMYFLHK
jgi:hypothetical protein